MKALIELPDGYVGTVVRNQKIDGSAMDKLLRQAVIDGTPLTPDILADLLMEERIRGELKQDISYSKDIINGVRCKLTVDIIDRRPCYCGAELREVWRESENKKWSNQD